MTIRRMLPFVLVNIIISAVVVLAILYWWDSQRPDETLFLPPTPSPTVALILATPPNSNNEGEASPTEPTSEGPPVYIVQAGDTLGKISTEFDVSVEEIMAANGMDNPNFIQVGQSLVIPVGGLSSTATPPPVPTGAFTPAPLPTLTPAFVAGDVQIEITEVVGIGNLTEESVLITNTGSQPVALQGWTLSDQSGRVYTFKQVTLFGDGAGIRLHTEAGQDSFADLYWGWEQPVWEANEMVSLRDSTGTLRAQFLIQP